MLPIYIGTSKNGTTSIEEISTAKSSDVTPPQKHDLHFWYIINLRYKFNFKLGIYIENT